MRKIEVARSRLEQLRERSQRQERLLVEETRWTEGMVSRNEQKNLTRPRTREEEQIAKRRAKEVARR
eukprot:15481192-Alexandrium_andersonii.AAC.1